LECHEGRECKNDTSGTVRTPDSRHTTNECLQDGSVPKTVAAQLGHQTIITLLMDNDRTLSGRLPALHVAAKQDDLRAVTLLLQHDPSRNKVNTVLFLTITFITRFTKFHRTLVVVVVAAAALAVVVKECWNRLRFSVFSYI